MCVGVRSSGWEAPAQLSALLHGGRSDALAAMGHGW